VPKDEEAGNDKTFPGLLTVKEGVSNEAIIDDELKHLFKGRFGWTIKKMNEDEYILHFPSMELRDELTKFKGFEFATAIIKAKVVPIEMEKEVVSLLEETWVKATSFPKIAKKTEVVKEISHLVGGPQEVDERG
jgi:hypothetical protein